SQDRQHRPGRGRRLICRPIRTCGTASRDILPIGAGQGRTPCPPLLYCYTSSLYGRKEVHPCPASSTGWCCMSAPVRAATAAPPSTARSSNRWEDRTAATEETAATSSSRSTPTSTP